MSRFKKLRQNICTILWSATASAMFGFSSNPALAGILDLEILRVDQAPKAYVDFCGRWPNECQTGAGPTQVESSNKLRTLLKRVNNRVNSKLRFQLDAESYDEEEYWNLPRLGRGDCEDNALEKRRLLRDAGLPAGALRMATAFHRYKFYAHAMLLVVTNNDVLVLDQDYDTVISWTVAPYIFEAVERTDGLWERYVQTW